MRKDCLQKLITEFKRRKVRAVKKRDSIKRNQDNVIGDEIKRAYIQGKIDLLMEFIEIIERKKNKT